MKKITKKKTTMKKLLFVALPLVGILLISFAAAGQVKKGKTRPLTTKQLMGGLVKPQCASLGAALKEKSADDKAWAALATKAALLNEASHTLMADGRCPDADWKAACETLRHCSGVVLEKIAAKDADGAQEAFGAMTKSCGACHSKHKK